MAFSPMHSQRFLLIVDDRWRLGVTEFCQCRNRLSVSESVCILVKFLNGSKNVCYVLIAASK